MVTALILIEWFGGMNHVAGGPFRPQGAVSQLPDESLVVFYIEIEPRWWSQTASHCFSTSKRN
jgi:hypothetical protein